MILCNAKGQSDKVIRLFAEAIAETAFLLFEFVWFHPAYTFTTFRKFNAKKVTFQIETILFENQQRWASECTSANEDEKKIGSYGIDDDFNAKV